jgi:hypothetical protein
MPDRLPASTRANSLADHEVMLDPSADSRRFGASTNFLVAVAALCAFLLAIALDASLRLGDWTISLFLFAAAAIAIAAVLTLRLEVHSNGLKRCFLIGSQSLDFDSVARARLEVLGRRGRGCFTLSLEPRQGWCMRIALRQFPIEASVAMLSALETRGIEVEVADERARYFAEQVVRARARSPSRAKPHRRGEARSRPRPGTKRPTRSA